MASEEASRGPRSQRPPFSWFDPESAAVVTILLGLFQMLLAASLAYTDHQLPKFYILPVFLGVLIVAGGSFIIANERNPSRHLLRGCACSNLLSLLASLIGLGLYGYFLNSQNDQTLCDEKNVTLGFHHCPPDKLAVYYWSIMLLLLIYDSGAVIVHSLLSFYAIKSLKEE